MKSQILQLSKKIIGVALILAGIIAGFIPIVQGWALILAGLLILGVRKEAIKKYLSKIKKYVKS